MPPAQQVFGDRYELVRHIARGGMAQVYLARDLLLDRQVALKVLFPELSVDPSFVERFRAEAKAAANLSHPNIVAVYDWGQGERTYFIVMEYIDGSTLSQQIRTAPLDPARAAVIGADVAGALEFAHRRGVIHRDVKPGNVLIDNAGQVKVADFGIARAVGAKEGLTQTGAVMGTATYFSPEQAQGLPVDARSDVYSLGVVLYEMVAGRAPFSGDNPVTIAYKHVREQPEPLASVSPGVAAPYAAIVAQALAKDPAARYPTAAALRADLQRFSAGQPVSAVDPAVAAAAGAATTVGLAVPPGAVSPGTRVMATEAYRGAPRDAAVAAVLADEDRTRRTLLVVAAVVVLLLLAAVLVGIFRHQLGLTDGSSSRAVPSNLVGEPLATAEGELKGLGFSKVRTNGAASNTVATGDVIATSPAAGTTVSTSSPVTLTVSTGAVPVAVPDVTNQPQAAATTTLMAAGFVVTVGSSQNSTTVPAGDVISTSPAPGVTAPKGSAVQLVLSAGQQTVQIPGLAGTAAATAANKLGQEGLTVTTRNEASGRYPAGDVTRTDPPAGSSVAIGSTVVLYVSDGPPETAVPNVVGDGTAGAETALMAAGLKVASQPEAVTDPSQVDEVLAQSPAAGTYVTPGSTVTITVGEGESTTTTQPAPSTTVPLVTVPSSTTTTATTTTTTTTPRV